MTVPPDAGAGMPGKLVDPLEYVQCGKVLMRKGKPRQCAKRAEWRSDAGYFCWVHEKECRADLGRPASQPQPSTDQFSAESSKSLVVNGVVASSPSGARTPEPKPVHFLTLGSDQTWCTKCKVFVWNDSEDGHGDEEGCQVNEGDTSKWVPVTVQDAQEALDALAQMYRDLDDKCFALAHSVSGAGARTDSIPLMRGGLHFPTFDPQTGQRCATCREPWPCPSAPLQGEARG